MADFFERIAPRVGVTVEQFQKLSGPDALGLYVSSLEKANLSQQEMTFFMEAMASDSTALIPLLKGNAEGLRAMSDEARRLGVVTSDLDIAKIEAARVSMSSAAAVSDAFNRQLATEAAPAIEAVAEGFKDWAAEMGGFDKVARATIDGLVTGAGFVSDVFRGWQIIIQGNIALLKTLFAEASRGLAALSSSTAEWRDEFWQSVDGLGERIGLELNIADAARTAAADFDEFASAAVNSANESIAELEKIMAEPLPSDALNERMSEWRTKAEEAAAQIVAAREAATVPTKGQAAPDQAPGSPAKAPGEPEQVQGFTVAESDAGIEQLRARLAERSSTFAAWRQTQTDAEGQFNRSQVELFKEFEATRAAEMEAAHAREDAIIADRLAKGLIDKQSAHDMQLQLDRDQHAEVVEARIQAAAELAEITGQPQQIDALGSEGADTVAALRERLQAEADTMAEYNQLQLEMLDAQQLAELEILQARRDADLLSVQDHEALKAAIEQEGADKRQQIAEMERAAKLSIFGGMMDNVSGLMQSGSRKLFEVGKAAALASGLISAYESVMTSYAAGSRIGGPWVGAAFAATAAIAQAANLRKISSASFGGGGSVSASSAGGRPSTNVPSAGGGSGSGSGGAGPAMPSRNISISLAGSSFSADTVRELITQINEQVGDGATLTAG